MSKPLPEETILELYAQGMGLAKIGRQLHLGQERIRDFLRAQGIDTTLRNKVPTETHKHPFSLLAVMDERHWTKELVAERVGVTEETVTRWRRDGLSLDKADLVAIRLGYMPFELWPQWLDEEAA